MSDLISRQAAIDIERNQTVDTNPYHFEAHQKFMQFMDDAEISSFGRWQWSNGFNTALTAVGIDLKKLPSAQPEINCSEFPNNSDTISRQAAIDALRTCYDTETITMDNGDEYINYGDAVGEIEQLPPIQPEPHWIPIDLENNEPPLEEWVLVSSDGYVMQDCIAERGGRKIWYHGGNIQDDDRYMPLPEPFKGVTE